MSKVTCPSCGALVRVAFLPSWQQGWVPQRPAKHYVRPGVPCLPKPKKEAG